MLAIKNGIMQPDEGSDTLTELARDFMMQHQAAYGKELLKPKHHWMVDVAQQVLRDHMVLDAFVIERQRLLVKGLAEHVRNTRDFEQSILASVTTVQLQQAREVKLGDGLVGQTSSLAELPHIAVGKKMMIFDVTLAVGDIVLRGDEVGRIVACAREDFSLFFFVCPLTKERQVTARACRFKVSADLLVWRADEVRQCNARREEPGGFVLAIAA